MILEDKSAVLEALGLFNSFYTFIIFILSCVSITFMGASYLVINFVRDTWVNFLEKRFPDLEFVRKTTIRSALDTHRNMGIITFLVTVKGNCDPLLIKNRLLEDLLDKKQNDGRYTYRHLRMTLTTRWGWYAWQKLVPFNIDNHLIFANPHYRGRPISDVNIQEYISETVSKYLVADLPPWQIVVFQQVTVEKYYLLIRFHHMLLSEEGLDLGDLLLISKNKNEISTGKLTLNIPPHQELKRSHPFEELYKTPKALPQLYDHIHEMFCNCWNEFLSAYDPVENPAVLKNPGLKETVAAFIIIASSLFKQALALSSRSGINVAKEFQNRGITVTLIFWSLWNTLNPFSVIVNSIKIVFNLAVFILIKLPLFLACEFRSACMIHDDKYLDASYIKTILALWLLIKDSFKEAFYYWKMIYNAPRIILEELLAASKHSRHHQLQFISLCGRKVVSWSDAVPLDKIHEIQDVTGASASEILISATSASLRDLLIQYSLDIPDNILTTARYFPQEQVIQPQWRKLTSACGGGILCLPLPMRNPFGLEYDPVTELRAVQQIILRARLRQPALYLASLSQIQYGILTQVLPSPILRLVLNLLSRRFPVTLTEIAPAEVGEFRNRYLWGQEVEDLMYWRPPQANICMSLTLMTFGGYVRLGVMADALLSPHHAVITSTFAQHIWDLAAAAGVSTNLPNYSFASDDSDTTGVSNSSHNTTLSSSSLDLDLESRNFSDEESNTNVYEPLQKYPISKKLKFNIPS